MIWIFFIILRVELINYNLVNIILIFVFIIFSRNCFLWLCIITSDKALHGSPSVWSCAVILPNVYLYQMICLCDDDKRSDICIYDIYVS